MQFLAHQNFCVVITALSLVSRLSDEMRERVSFFARMCFVVHAHETIRLFF